MSQRVMEVGGRTGGIEGTIAKDVRETGHSVYTL